MMTPVLFALPGNEAMTATLSAHLALEIGSTVIRRFPDEETYVRITTPVADRDVLLVCTLDHPDTRVLPLLFLAETAKELGARQVGLVAPYLAYMRQDRRFQKGEAVTSRYFARLIGHCPDWLVTVDPHLHRYGSLAELYPIPTYVVHAAPLIAQWIRTHVDRPVLVGPDSESAQWVAAVAAEAEAPFLVLEKVRRGDRDVVVSIPETDRWKDRTPVLVDDIVSTARTMIETVGHLCSAALRPPVCVGVHGIFAGQAYEELLEAGAARIATSNTIPHLSNEIDLGPLLAEAITQLL